MGEEMLLRKRKATDRSECAGMVDPRSRVYRGQLYPAGVYETK